MVGHNERHAVSGGVEHRSNFLGPPWRASHESAVTGRVDSPKLALGDGAGQIHDSSSAAGNGWFQFRRPHRDAANDQGYWSFEEFESPLYRLNVPVRPPSANHCHHELGVRYAEFTAGRSPFVIAYIHARIGNGE